MTGLSQYLSQECKKVFLECDEFDNLTYLRGLCKTIIPLGDLITSRLVEAKNKKLLVMLNLNVLLEIKHQEHGCIFPLFLQVLRDNYDEQDERWHKIDTLREKVIQELDNQAKECQQKTTWSQHKLFNSIIEIDFKDQEDNIIKAIHYQENLRRKAAFLVNGYDNRYGQTILIERLFRKLPQLINARKITIKLDGGCEISRFWEQIAPDFFGSEHIPKMTRYNMQEQIINKISECLQSQNLIFIFYIPEYLLAGFLSDLIQHFWQPIVDRVNHQDTYLTMFLVEHNHKKLGAKSLGTNLVSEFKDEPNYPSYPLYLNQLSEFSSKHLNEWLDNGVEETIRQSLLAGMQQKNFVDKLLKETEWGIPELVYKKICRYFDVSWEEIDQCQIQ